MSVIRATWVTGTVIVGISWISTHRAVAALTVDLEVTQGIQYFEHPDPAKGTNTIDLVADRPAVVRARVTGGPAGASITAINATLAVVPSPGAPPAALPSISGPLNADDFKAVLNSGAAWNREDANSTINFRVRSIAAGPWDFKVDATLTFADGTSAAGQGRASLSAVEVRPVQIRLVPLVFQVRAGHVYSPDPVELEDAIAFLRACYPLPETAEILWESPLQPLDRDKGCPGKIDDRGGRKSDVNQILRALAALRAVTVASGTVPPDLFYYGFSEPRPNECTMIADKHCGPILGWGGACEDGAAFGTANVRLAGKVFAHELGHLVGLEHCSGGDCPDPASSAPPCDLDGQVGFDVLGALGGSAIPGTSHTSFMNCGGECMGPSTTSWWATPGDYKRCLEVLKVGSTEARCRSTGRNTDSPGPRALVVHGAVTPGGDAIEWLDPVFRYPWTISPTLEPSSGPYEIEAADATGEAIFVRPFDVRQSVERSSGSPGSTSGFFSVVLPFPEDKEVETLTVRKDGAVLHTVKRSRACPKIGRITLGPGASSKRAAAIEWTVADADTDAADLLHQVLYSPDGGESFEPVAVNLEAPAAVFDPDRFPPSKPGQGLLRVFVSDGLNTTIKDITLPLSDLEIPSERT